jgi:Ferritin-like domain
VTGRIIELFEAARTDSGLFKAALHVEEVAALAYTAAADGSLEGDDRALARRFAEHERQHAAAFETMLFALTVPVRAHAGPDDVDALVPGLRGAGRRETLRALAELEGAAIAGHQLIGRRLGEHALDALRTVAAVMAGGAQHLVVLRHALGDATLTRAFESGS